MSLVVLSLLFGVAVLPASKPMNFVGTSAAQDWLQPEAVRPAWKPPEQNLGKQPGGSAARPPGPARGVSDAKGDLREVEWQTPHPDTQPAFSSPSKANKVFLPSVTWQPCDGFPLSGRVFHDLNANGIRDAAYPQGDHTANDNGFIGFVGPNQEPPVGGARVRAGGDTSTSNPDGQYALCLSSGPHQVTIEAEPFRFRFPSANEIAELGEPIPVLVPQQSSLNIGLGVGPLTIPYRLDEAHLFRQGSFVDIDPGSGEVGIYRSYPEDCQWWHCTGDAHRGIDLYAPEGTLVVAAAPGLVTKVDVRPNLIMVFLIHTDIEDVDLQRGVARSGQGIEFQHRGFETSYQHLSSVAGGVVKGAFLERGHPIGYLDNGTHLHFDAQWHFGGSSCRGRCYVDPYRDEYHDSFVWKEHDSNYGYPIWISWGSPGWWTADNLPHFGPN